MSQSEAALGALWTAIRAAAAGKSAHQDGELDEGQRFEFGDEVADAFAEVPRAWSDLTARFNVLAKSAGVSVTQPTLGEMGRGPEARQKWLHTLRANVNRLLETVHEQPQTAQRLIPAAWLEAEAKAELAEHEGRQSDYDAERAKDLSVPLGHVEAPLVTGDHEALLADPNLLRALVKWGEQYVQGAPDVLQALFLQTASVVAPQIRQGEVAHRGPIHILLAGEFATGKSGLLGLARMIAPRVTALDSVTFPGFVGTFKRVGGEYIHIPGAAARSDKTLLIVDEYDKSVARDRELDGAVRTVMTHQPYSRFTAFGEIRFHARPAILAAVNPENDLFIDGALREQLNQPLGALSRWDMIRPFVQTVERTDKVLDFMADGWFEPPKEQGGGAARTLTAEDVQAVFLALYRAVKDANVERVSVPPEFKHAILALLKQHQREVGGVPILSARDLESAFRFLQASAILHLRQRSVSDGILTAAQADLDVALEMLAFAADVRAKLFEKTVRRALAANPFDRAYAWVKRELEQSRQLGKPGLDYQELVEGLVRTQGLGRSTAYRWVAEFIERDPEIECLGLRNGLVRLR